VFAEAELRRQQTWECVCGAEQVGTEQCCYCYAKRAHGERFGRELKDLREANAELTERNRQHHADKHELNEEVTRLKAELAKLAKPIAVVVPSNRDVVEVRTVTTPEEYQQIMGVPAPKEFFEKPAVMFHTIGENQMGESGKPTSYPTNGPAIVSEKPKERHALCSEHMNPQPCPACLTKRDAPQTPKLTTEQACAEVRHRYFEYRRTGLQKDVDLLHDAINRLPLGPIDSCIDAGRRAVGCAPFCEINIEQQDLELDQMSAALRRFCELEGIKVPKYLEGK
jgi:hypothetical protein